MGRLVVAPDATVRFLRERAVLHNAHVRAAPLLTDSPRVFQVLLQFLAPLDPDLLHAGMPPDRRQEFNALLQALQGAGVLVEAQDAPATRSGAERKQIVQRQLSLLANAVAELAGDLAALGSIPFHRNSGSDAIHLEHRMEALLFAFDSIRTEISDAHAALLRTQLSRIRDSGMLRDLKLHIGAGSRHLEGWVNVDVYPADLSVNVNRTLPFTDGSARLIFASHILEHLYYPSSAMFFLQECRRLLAPHGRLRVVVPDIEKYIRAYAERDDKFFADRRKTWRRLPENRTRLEEFLSYAGVGPDPAAFLESHKYGYDFDTLEKALHSAGFEQVVRSNFDSSELPELRVDSVSEVAHAETAGRHYSLFVEAAIR